MRRLCKSVRSLSQKTAEDGRGRDRMRRFRDIWPLENQKKPFALLANGLVLSFGDPERVVAPGICPLGFQAVIWHPCRKP